MSLADLERQFRLLKQARNEGRSLAEPWSKFVSQVRAGAGERAPQVQQMARHVLRYAGDRRADVVILDHGCGGGFNLVYLMALGFTNVWGFDVSEDNDRWNPLLQEVFGVREKRFQVFDGRKLPMPDASVDVVLSQQVLEHVTPVCIDDYYAEEGRVLKAGGIAVHEVPHRFAPYDSHTRTWFVHYLPRGLRGGVYRALGVDPTWASNTPAGLYVRSPYFHKQMAHRHIGPVEDKTVDKLRHVADVSDFDGSGLARFARHAAHTAVTLPIVGGVVGGVVANLVQLETVTVRRPR